MRQVLVIGAGRSASSLIKYLLENSEKENLHITIGDLSKELANKNKNHKNATAIEFDILMKIKERQKLAKQTLFFQCYLLIYILKLLKIVSPIKSTW